MGRITLSLRGTVAARIDLADMSPDHFAHLDERDIAAEPLRIGRQTARVGDIFDVRGGRADEIVIEGALQRVDGIGSGMSGGRLIVDGDAGAFVGALMSGGVIEARGRVGAEAGIGMSGGTLRVRGDAGDRLGANLPGASHGMTGGEIVVSGSAGREVGARCRRGLIVVAGSVGPEAGRAMVAGTIVVSGDIGACPGRGNRRGSIVALAGVDVPATYRYACTYDPPYLRLLFRYLSREYGFVGATPPGAISRFRRYCGDAGQPGKGEFLVRDA
jgi:formylmethanofuran dehydrogenase subunit C